MARATYQVVPRPRQVDPYAAPDEWAIKKGNTTVQTFDMKRAAKQRAKELAKNQNETLDVFDAAKKGAQSFDYRKDEDRRAQRNKANRKAVDRGLGEGFGPL